MIVGFLVMMVAESGGLPRRKGAELRIVLSGAAPRRGTGVVAVSQVLAAVLAVIRNDSNPGKGVALKFRCSAKPF
jgi:hypothetical protein